MVRGGLFSRYFLEDGIRQLEAYQRLDAADVTAFADFVRKQWSKIARMPHPNEGETESEFIHPTLERLGWHRLPQQEPSKGRRDIADELLFLDEETKNKARSRPSAERFRLGVVVVENEARDTRLDRAGSNGEAPSAQLLRYLSRAETQSDGACQWGLLTNGRFWRIYWAHAPSRVEGFVEIELSALVEGMPPPVPSGADELHWLRVFLLLFRKKALAPEGVEGITFLDLALREGRHYEQHVTEKLSSIAFDDVFPNLIATLGKHANPATPADANWRASIREASLIILYRLLFLLYAEDRDLLPVGKAEYAAYGLRELRHEAAEIVDGHKAISESRTIWWGRLKELFKAIAEGDAGMGLPPYNGGLFDDSEFPILATLKLPDGVLARLIDALSREKIDDKRRWINYRDLSVQHLGGIYERLLEREVVANDAGELILRPSIFARRTSGSYYTPDELVRLIIRRAVGPLIAERNAAFVAKAEELKSDKRSKADRIDELRRLDPATAFVSLRVCDPAMGSGHFLVTLVDYLADQISEAIADAPKRVDWAEYRSPLATRIEALRAHIRDAADKNGWVVSDDQLDDRHLIRRIILKRVIYGVDLNPMAVELAKLSLWLHSFTVGAPLSFLDHHLRCGDSLFGEFVRPVEDIAAKEAAMFLAPTVTRARNAAKGMTTVEELTDADIGEVRTSASTFRGVEEATSPLIGFMDFIHAMRWLSPLSKEEQRIRAAILSGTLGDPIEILSGRTEPKGAATPTTAAKALLKKTSELIAERRFFHWEVAFPGVWNDWESNEPSGGFDAVIGNPPWDRMKLQEVEWFAGRVSEIAHAERASDRKKMIGKLKKENPKLSDEFERAAQSAESALKMARRCGAYPLLSRGDVNLYSLFVERATRIVRKDGIVGLLVPSGISADKGASEFFRGISTSGRLGTLFDFENRRHSIGLSPFFPDIDSRIKFCVLVTGGGGRKFAETVCAFFQQDAEVAEKSAFTLTADDFAVVNPNTGTAPFFRSKRDADITLDIYRRLPVLVDRRSDEPKSVWPVRYVTMLHMTNDSDKFRTAAELEKLGAYRVEGQRWQKGNQQWFPLMAGRSIHQFDHRAASVTENPDNLHNPFATVATTAEEHADPAYSPSPQFWVEETDVSWPDSIPCAIGFRDIARPTDERTQISALVPKAACSNKLPLLFPLDEADAPGYDNFGPLLLANLNSLAHDFVVRQKVHGATINLYVLEQLPVIPREAFTRRFGPKTAEQIIREDVLHLTYVSNDMKAFARTQGNRGEPFAWDEEDRLRRRARLDAVFFHLYGLDRDAADYILGTFPIVREHEEAAYGRFRSRDLILGYMAALAAGNPDAKVAG